MKIKKLEKPIRITTTNSLGCISTSSVLKRLGEKSLIYETKLEQKKYKLKKPLDSTEEKRARRRAGYYKICEDVSRWKDIVNYHRKAPHVQYPLVDGSLKIQDIEAAKQKHGSSNNPLAKDIYNLLSESKLTSKTETDAAEDPRDEKMTYEQIKEKVNEVRLFRALKARVQRKAAHRNSIKSKSYHHVLRREDQRKKETLIKSLVEMDVEKAEEMLKKMDLSRIKERMTLRHKNSAWTKSRSQRSFINPKTMAALKENARIHHELRDKIGVNVTEQESEEEIDINCTEDPQSTQNFVSVDNLDVSNPWVAQLQYRSQEDKTKAIQPEEDFTQLMKFLQKVNHEDALEKDEHVNKLVQKKDNGFIPIISNKLNLDSSNSSVSTSTAVKFYAPESNSSKSDASKTNTCKFHTSEPKPTNSKTSISKVSKSKTSKSNITNSKVDKSLLKFQPIITNPSPPKNQIKVKNFVRFSNGFIVTKYVEGSSFKDIVSGSHKRCEGENVSAKLAENGCDFKRKPNSTTSSNAKKLKNDNSIKANRKKDQIEVRSMTNSTIPNGCINIRDHNSSNGHKKSTAQSRVDKNSNMSFTNHINIRPLLSASLEETPLQRESIETYETSNRVLNESFEIREKDPDINSGIATQFQVLSNTAQKEKSKPHQLTEVKVKERILESSYPKVTDEPDGLDNDENPEDIIQDAFADDYLMDDFKAAKAGKEEKEEEAIIKLVDTKLPGWGRWGGPNLLQKKDKREKDTKMHKCLRKPSDKNENSHVIYNEENDIHPNIKALMVDQLPKPYLHVSDYESTMSSPIGTSFVPYAEHIRLVEPAVSIRKGQIIKPMGEEALLKFNQMGAKKKKRKDLRTLPIMKKNESKKNL